MNIATGTPHDKGRRHVGLMLLLMVVLLAMQATVEAQIPNGLRPSTGRPDGQLSVMNSSSSNNGGQRSIGVDSTLVGDSLATTGLQSHKEVADSILAKRVFLFYYRPGTVKIDDIWSPTLSPTGIEQCDQTETMNGDYYLGKGMIGHPHESVFPKPTERLGMRLQADPMVGYTKRPENIRLYQTMTPYTVLQYNSSLDKDYMVHIGHTQNVMPGWNVAFDYKLIRPEGTYTSSGAKDHFLDISTNYFSRDSRIQAAAGVIWQSFRIDENGGISDDTYFTEQKQSNSAGVPVNLYNMGTLQKEIGAFAHATFNTVRQFDYTRQRDSIVAREENDTTIFDTIVVTDSIHIGRPQVVNTGVFGIEANYDRRKRVFVDSTWWRETTATLFWTNDAYVDYRWRNPVKLTVGIKPHIVEAIVGGDSLLHKSRIDPFANATISIGRMEIRAEAESQASLDKNGSRDSRLSAMLMMPLDSNRRSNISLSVVRKNSMPDVRMVMEAKKNQGLKLTPIAAERYGIRLKLRELMKLDVSMSHMSHNTWYDTTRTIHEGSDGLWLYQAALTMQIKMGWLHIDMQQLLQHSTDEYQMPVPLLASKNSLYADFSLFGHTVNAQVGVDVRYHTPFYAPTYDPYTGLFLHQDEMQVGGYIWADAFININVRRASFYIKAGHVNALIETSPNYFILPHYPGNGFGLYWGLTWHFFD